MSGLIVFEDNITPIKDDAGKIQYMEYCVNKRFSLTSPHHRMSTGGAGAICAGEIPKVFSRKTIGLLITYISYGVILGSFPCLVYPFLFNYLQMEAYQMKAAATMFKMKWIKPFAGIVSDSFPIFGFRRRPYMIIGWTMCCTLLLIMASLPHTLPYFHNKLQDKNHELNNYDAPNAGFIYIILGTLACLSCNVVEGAANGRVVELSQQEPEMIRGTFNAAMYIAFFGSQVISQMLIGMCMNGQEYGGSFSWSLSFSHIMLILSVFAFIPIPATMFFLSEPKVTPEPFCHRMKTMWAILQTKAIWQVMLYCFLSGILNCFSSTATTPVMQIWAGVEPLQECMFAALGVTIMAISTQLLRKFGLGWNWRYTIALGVISMTVIDSFVSFSTIFNLIRNKWFFLSGPAIEMLPLAINILIMKFLAVEIATEGYEGTTCGLIGAVVNLCAPFASSMTNLVDRNFAITRADIASDTDYVRMQVFYTYVLMYLCDIASLFCLGLLPAQKREALELKKNGGSSRLGGICAASGFIFVLIWSVTLNVMSVFPSTSCLPIAGGKGCH